MSASIKRELPHQAEIGQMAKGTAFIAVGELIGNVIKYLTSIIITRTIGAQLFGLFFLGNIVIFIGGMVSRLGLDYAVLRFVSFYKGQKDYQRLGATINTGIGISTVLSIVVATVIFISAPWIANFIFKKPALTPVVKILALSLPLSNIILLVINAILGLQIVKYKVLIENIIQPFVRLIFIGLLFILNMKLMGVVWATTISTAVTAIYGFFCLSKVTPKTNGEPLIYEKSKLISYAAPIFGESFLNFIIYWVDILLLGYFASSTDVGIMGVVFRITMILVFVQYSFNAIISPMISELYGKNELKKIEQLFKIQTRWSFTLTLPLLLLILFFATPILQIFGEHFEDGALALIIMSAGRFFDAGIGACGMILMMVGKPKINTINSAIILIIKIILNIILIPKYGLLGAAISSSISVALLDLMRVLEVFYILKIHPYSLAFLKPIISALITGCGILLTNWIVESNSIKLAIAGLFMLSYFIILYFLKLDEEDKFLFQRLYQKFAWNSAK